MAHKLYKQVQDERGFVAETIEGIKSIIYFTGYPAPLRLTYFIADHSLKTANDRSSGGYALLETLIGNKWAGVADHTDLDTLITRQINGVLDWDEENDKYVHQVEIDNAIFRTSKKFEELIDLMYGKSAEAAAPEKKKVYTLICDSIYGYSDAETSAALFYNKEDAIKQLRAEYENTSKEWGVSEEGEDDCRMSGEIAENEMYACIQEEGAYSETHCVWMIEELEIH